MHIKGIKIHVVIIALVAGLAAFLGAQWLYKGLNFQKPLIAKLENNPVVISYKIDDSADIYKINLALSESVDLMNSYQQIFHDVKQVMGKRPFTIELTDRRNNQLDNVYGKGKFAIYEALQNGDFVQMASNLNLYASEAGIESKVDIDDHNIYWQMKDDQHYLYSVIPRGNTESIFASAETGGR
ncbi:hypothetical protein SAMN05660649_01801 [Desulfotomaculum arcticum]|uniref:Uncharacterized protein n=1 Tax=Desulfotruncus arcticus DSM 17038 TaxID=1121424 RepID=A0A1I2S6W0_9FIRM|nr:hypothetical protein [Desulfotruncus arcticus]SFG48634.1 hypothetical protein SAMN05660649_01801 [Desulfotomaculum arcticum] [Desulfotruncus arcticus DSM 17038]